MNDWYDGTPENDWVSMAVASNGEYGVPEGLISSFPVTISGGEYSIVQGLEHNDFAKERIQRTVNELIDEREQVRALGLIE